MIEEQLFFKFYSELYNEDAEPFLDDGLMVVADGLGGMGSPIHVLENFFYEHPDQIKKGLIRSISYPTPQSFEKVEWLKPYIDILLKRMIDKEPDTSALWASRIVIARFIYALKEIEEFSDVSSKEKRNELADYITTGLKYAVKVFNLIPGKFDNQKLLPTTLAAISYIEEGDKIVADVIWAGDSRCYAITEDGLKQLSIDDETSGGIITNKFSVDDTPAILNYRQYNFKKPCVLMVASDGIFDPYAPYENLGVEAILLSILQKSHTMQGFSNQLKQHYEKVRGDDATMAFTALGFESFEDLKNKLLPRTDTVLKVWNRYKNMKSTLEIINSQDIESYIKTRTVDKIETIVQRLAEAYNNKQNDIVLTNALRNKLDTNVEHHKNDLERKKEKEINEILINVKEYILNNPSEVIKSVLSEDENIDFKKAPKLGHCFSELKVEATNFMDAKIKHETAHDESIAMEEKGKAIINDVRQKMTEIHEQLQIGNTKELLDEYQALCNIQNHYKENKSKCASISGLSERSKPIANDVDNFILEKNRCERNLKDANEDCESKNRQYKTAVNNFFSHKDEIMYGNNMKILFQEQFINRYALDFSNQNEDKNTDGFAVLSKEMLLGICRNPTIINEIVTALAKNYDNKSIIDSCYNETKLAKFRECHRLEATPSTEAEKFKVELEAFVAEYERLLQNKSQV